MALSSFFMVFSLTDIHLVDNYSWLTHYMAENNQIFHYLPIFLTVIHFNFLSSSSPSPVFFYRCPSEPSGISEFLCVGEGAMGQVAAILPLPAAGSICGIRACLSSLLWFVFLARQTLISLTYRWVINKIKIEEMQMHKSTRG